METIRFQVNSVSPILMNNPKSMRRTAEGTVRKKIPAPEEEAESKVYALPDGQLYVPADALRSSLIEGGVGWRIGRMGAKRVLMTTVFLTHEHCPLRHTNGGGPITEYAVDVRRVVVVGQGVMRARPRVEEWETEIELEYDDEVMTPETLLRAFNTAGKRVGILDYRPLCPRGKGGPFGRYSVEIAE